MALFWDNSNYQKWILNECDLNSASEVGILELYLVYDDKNHETIPINFGAGVLKHFVNLRILYLSQSCLTDIPEEVWELTQLTELYVHYNDICEISPKIKNLTNLIRLDCHRNNLTTLPNEICQLTKLKYFNYAGNKLDILDKKVMDFVTQIEYVNRNISRD